MERMKDQRERGSLEGPGANLVNFVARATFPELLAVAWPESRNARRIRKNWCAIFREGDRPAISDGPDLLACRAPSTVG